MTLFGSARDARRVLGILGGAFLLTLLLALLPFRTFQVDGKSMQPSLESGEKILVEGLTLQFAPLGRGDIVVFRHPSNPRRYLVKRVVGLPGETVEIREGGVFADGQRLEEAYLDDSDRESGRQGPLRLGPSEYFVLGDERQHSEDSRVWGPLPAPFIVGRAVLAYWPPHLAGRL